MGRDSPVGFATCYEVDGPGIEFRWRWDIPRPSKSSLGSTQPPVQRIPGHCWGVKLPGCGVNHPTPPGAKVQEREEWYFYSPSVSSWPVLGITSPLNVLDCTHNGAPVLHYPFTLLTLTKSRHPLSSNWPVIVAMSRAQCRTGQFSCFFSGSPDEC